MLEGRSNAVLWVTLLLLLMPWCGVLPKTSAGWRSELVGVWGVRAWLAEEVEAVDDGDDDDEEAMVAVVDGAAEKCRPATPSVAADEPWEDADDAGRAAPLAADAVAAASRAASPAPGRKPTDAAAADAVVAGNPPRGGGEVAVAGGSVATGPAAAAEDGGGGGCCCWWWYEGEGWWPSWRGAVRERVHAPMASRFSRSSGSSR